MSCGRLDQGQLFGGKRHGIKHRKGVKVMNVIHEKCLRDRRNDDVYILHEKSDFLSAA